MTYEDCTHEVDRLLRAQSRWAATYELVDLHDREVRIADRVIETDVVCFCDDWDRGYYPRDVLRADEPPRAAGYETIRVFICHEAPGMDRASQYMWLELPYDHPDYEALAAYAAEEAMGGP